MCKYMRDVCDNDNHVQLWGKMMHIKLPIISCQLKCSNGREETLCHLVPKVYWTFVECRFFIVISLYTLMACIHSVHCLSSATMICMTTTGTRTIHAMLTIILRQIDMVIWAATETSHHQRTDENTATRTLVTWIGGKNRLLLAGSAVLCICVYHTSLLLFDVL